MVNCQAVCSYNSLASGPRIYRPTLLQLHQLQANWIAYRSLCEALKHEEYLYFSRQGVYAGATDASALNAERIAFLISREYAQWQPGALAKHTVA